MAPLATPGWSSLPAFATLDLCLAHVREKHPQKLVSRMATDIGTGRSIRTQMPAYLYRGEVGWISECVSRMERVRRGHFTGVTTQELEPIGQDVDQELQARLKIGPMLSAGLMQHYGFPTELMDATASLDTATIFSRLSSGGTAEGAIAVFDISVLYRNAKVIDLSSHPRAQRPRRQEAYGVFSGKHVNLKHHQAIVDMGITWYTFLADSHETSRVSGGTGLLSVSDDETAGLLRLWLDGSIEKYQKVSQPVAEYLAHRIAHCPLVLKPISWYEPRQIEEGVLVTPDAANIAVDEQVEIDTSIKVWSRRYPNTTKRPFMQIG